MTCDVQVELVKFTPPALPFPDPSATIEVTHANLAGIVPKGVILQWVKGDPESADSACWGTGACDEFIDMWGVSWAAGDGVLTSSTDYVREARILEIPPCDGDATTQANDGNARIDKFIPGGFEMTWFDGSPGDAYDVEGVALVAIIFAGQDVMTQAGKHDIDSTPLSVDRIGFPPDGVYTASPAQDAADADLQDEWHGGWGFADLQTINNVAHLRSSRVTGMTNEYRESLRSAEAQGNIRAAALDYTVRYDDPGNPDDLIGTEAIADNGVDADEIPYFAFRAAGVDVRAGIVVGPGAAGDWVVTDPGFKPQFVMLMNTTLQSVDQQINHDGFFGMSYFTDDDQFATWVNYENNSATPVARSGIQSKARYLDDKITPAVLLDGSFKSFDDNGWTLDMEIVQQGGAGVDPSGWRTGYLCIGECEQAPEAPPAEEEDDCVDDVWLNDAGGAAADQDADVLVAVGRYQVDPTQDAVYEFLTDDLQGKTPKGALFFANYTGATSGQDTVADELQSIGAASKSPGGALRRWVLATNSEDAVSPDVCGQQWLGKVILELDRGGLCQTNANGLADVLDFIPGGVRLQTIDAFSLALNVVVVFFAGDDLDAYAWRWDTFNAPDGSQMGGLGFQPDLLVTTKAGDDFAVQGDVGGPLAGLGGVNLRNAETEIGAYERLVSLSGGLQEGAAALNPTKVGFQPNFAPFPRQIRKTQAGNPFGDGFEAIESDADPTGFLALRLPETDVWVSELEAPIATGNWDVADPGFTPQFALLVQGMTDKSGDEDADVVVDARAGSLGIGVFTDLAQHAVAAASEIGVTPTNTESSVDDNAVYLNDDAGASAFRGSFSGWRTTGWRIAITDADPTQRLWLALAIGRGGEL